jgi:hypothetical protein
MIYHEILQASSNGGFFMLFCTKVFTKCEHFTLQNVSYNPPKLVKKHQIWRDIASYNPPKVGKSGR